MLFSAAGDSPPVFPRSASSSRIIRRAASMPAIFRPHCSTGGAFLAAFCGVGGICIQSRPSPGLNLRPLHSSCGPCLDQLCFAEMPGFGLFLEIEKPKPSGISRLLGKNFRCCDISKRRLFFSFANFFYGSFCLQYPMEFRLLYFSYQQPPLFPKDI